MKIDGRGNVPITHSREGAAKPAPVRADAQRPEPDAEQPVEAWRSRMTGPGFRDIEVNQVPDEHAQGVAHLCLELSAGHHANAVKRVLSMNGNVRAHAMAMLKTDPPRDADQQSGLALCLLDAGYPIPLDRDVAEAVTRIVQGRDDWEESHWARQAAKFEPSLAEPPDPDFRPPDYMGNPPKYQGKGLPHAYLDPKYSLDNLNGWIAPDGLADEFSEDNLVCQQLQKAADGTLVIDGATVSTKQFLTLPLEQGADAVGLDREHLVRADAAEVRATFGVNFEPQHFGALLRELCLDLPVGEERGFRVGYRKAVGHVMRVFVRKEAATRENPEGVISVHFYEPSLTRTMFHVRTLPERLALMNWEQFDVKHKRERGNAQVLHLRVHDKQLAARCAGKFVSPTRASRVAGLSQAVAIGDRELMATLLGELAAAPPESFTPDEIADLENGLTWAINDRDTRGIELFMSGLGRLQLSSAQKAQIAMARGRDRKMALAARLEAGDRGTAEAFMQGLRAMQLDPAHIAEIFTARGAGTPPLLCCVSNAQAVDEFGRRLPPLGSRLVVELRALGLEQMHIDAIVNAPGGMALPAMVAKGDWVGAASLIRAMGHWQSPADLIAPGLLQVSRNPDQKAFDMLASECKARGISLASIAAQLPLALTAATDAHALDAISASIHHFARWLDAKEQTALLTALEKAQGTRNFFGLKNSKAMSALKETHLDAYKRFVAAKNVLRT